MPRKIQAQAQETQAHAHAHAHAQRLPCSGGGGGEANHVKTTSSKAPLIGECAPGGRLEVLRAGKFTPRSTLSVSLPDGLNGERSAEQLKAMKGRRERREYYRTRGLGFSQAWTPRPILKHPIPDGKCIAEQSGIEGTRALEEHRSIREQQKRDKPKPSPSVRSDRFSGGLSRTVPTVNALLSSCGLRAGGSERASGDATALSHLQARTSGANALPLPRSHRVAPTATSLEMINLNKTFLTST